MLFVERFGGPRMTGRRRRRAIKAKREKKAAG
jgi:hypothetical protein